MKLKTNQGVADRIVRGVMGVGLIFLTLYLFNILEIVPAIIAASIAVVISTFLILTSVFGHCFIYKLFGFNTLSEEQKEKRAKKNRKEAKRRAKKLKKRLKREKYN